LKQEKLRIADEKEAFLAAKKAEQGRLGFLQVLILPRNSLA
jgi:hypothetical protein